MEYKVKKNAYFCMLIKSIIWNVIFILISIWVTEDTEFTQKEQIICLGIAGVIVLYNVLIKTTLRYKNHRYYLGEKYIISNEGGLKKTEHVKKIAEIADIRVKRGLLFKNLCKIIMVNENGESEYVLRYISYVDSENFVKYLESVMKIKNKELDNQAENVLYEDSNTESFIMDNYNQQECIQMNTLNEFKDYQNSIIDEVQETEFADCENTDMNCQEIVYIPDKKEMRINNIMSLTLLKTAFIFILFLVSVICILLFMSETMIKDLNKYVTKEMITLIAVISAVIISYLFNRFKFKKFKLIKTNNYYEVRYGVQVAKFKYDDIKEVNLCQTLISSIFRKYAIKVKYTGDDGIIKDTYISPFLSKVQSEEVISEILPEYANVIRLNEKRNAKAAIYNFLQNILVILIICIIIYGYEMINNEILAGIAIGMLLNIIFYFGESVCSDGKYLGIKSVLIVVNRKYIKYKDIEGIRFSQGPFERIFKVMSLVVEIKSSIVTGVSGIDEKKKELIIEEYLNRKVN